LATARAPEYVAHERVAHEHFVPESGANGAARAYHAGVQLLVLRLELWAAQARVLARSGVLGALGAVAGLIGWLYLVAGAVNALSEELPRSLVQIGAGVLHLLIAGALLAWSRRAARRLEEER
jgi:hypothetical protein